VLRDFYNKQGSNNLTEPQKNMLKNASGFKKYYGVPKRLRGYRSAAGLKKSVKGEGNTRLVSQTDSTDKLSRKHITFFSTPCHS
jgi:hypothetical protein